MQQLKRSTLNINHNEVYQKLSTTTNDNSSNMKVAIITAISGLTISTGLYFLEALNNIVLATALSTITISTAMVYEEIKELNGIKGVKAKIKQRKLSKRKTEDIIDTLKSINTKHQEIVELENNDKEVAKNTTSNFQSINPMVQPEISRNHVKVKALNR